MLLINNTNINPYFNLAMEEYFLKNAKEDIFLLWQNENAIIVGKNQNTLSEINYDYVQNNNIKAVSYTHLFAPPILPTRFITPPMAKT